MRALITAPSRSPPGREKGRNERRKQRLRSCLPSSGTARKDTAESVLWGRAPGSSGATLRPYRSTRSRSAARQAPN